MATPREDTPWLIETSSGVREVRDAVGGAELSPDDTHLALWGAASQSLRGVPRGRVVLARVVDGAELHTLDFGDREIVRTLFTPEGALLVVHHEPRTNLVTVEWFDLHARERTGSLVLADLGELRQVDHAPNAHRALFCGLRGWSLVDLRGVGVVAQAAWADHQHNWSPYRDGNYIDAYVHPDGGSFVLDVNTSDESSTRHVVTVGKTAAQRVEVEGVIGQSARWIDRVHFADFADVPSSENECVVRVFDVERPYSHGEIFGAETEDIPQYIRELFLNLVDVAWTADGHRAVLCNRTRERPYECSVATVDLFGDTRPHRAVVRLPQALIATSVDCLSDHSALIFTKDKEGAYVGVFDLFDGSIEWECVPAPRTRRFPREVRASPGGRFALLGASHTHGARVIDQLVTLA